MNKYGSNVVEKCLREASEDHLSQIINELVDSKDFLMVLQDPYGNYVAQSALVLAKVYMVFLDKLFTNQFVLNIYTFKEF